MLSDLQVSHYRVVSRLGQGGMGEVYRGVDETLRRNVALKAIRADRRLEPVAKARFIREARILSQLDHPNICRVYDYIETPDRDWLVLELVEGETLRAAIQRGLSPPAKLAIARQIASVLVATHAAGVIHRDLKPANVMLTTGGEVKVLDFGLSATLAAVTEAPSELADHSPAGRAADPEHTYLPPSSDAHSGESHFASEAGTIVGTVAYMSPEQARGEVVTPASDMYSFGLIVQELFTGEPPYDTHANALTLLDRARRGESRDALGMPSALSALVKRLKAFAPTQRPTAVDTLDRLQWITDAPKRRTRNLAIAAVLVMGMLGAIKYTVDLSRERTAALLARDEADQRRKQAEDLIGFMVGDLRTKLAAVGRLEILDDVGKKALAYFAAVPVGALTDEELFRRSEAMHQLGQVRQARGDLDGAGVAFAESLTQASALVERAPDNPKWLLGLGTSHFYVGDLLRRRGDLDGAFTHFQKYQQIARQLVDRDPGNFAWRMELSYGHSSIAAVLSSKGDFAGARQQLETTADLQAELARVKPDDVALQTSRANNYNRLGIVLERLGDLQGAARRFESELEIYAALVARNTKDARMMRRAEVSRIYLGHTLRALGDEEGALRHFEAALRETMALVALDVTNADWRRDEASSHMALGRILLERGRLDEANGHFRAALAFFGPRLLVSNNAPTAARDVAHARQAIAEVLIAERQWEAAERELTAASAALAPLDAKDVNTAVDLSSVDNLRGLLARGKGNSAQAIAAWNRSAERLAPLVTQRSYDRNVLEPWVCALFYLGRLDEARQGFDKLARLGYRNRAFLRMWNQPT